MTKRDDKRNSWRGGGIPSKADAIAAVREWSATVRDRPEVVRTIHDPAVSLTP